MSLVSKLSIYANEVYQLTEQSPTASLSSLSRSTRNYLSSTSINSSTISNGETSQQYFLPFLRERDGMNRIIGQACLPF